MPHPRMPQVTLVSTDTLTEGMEVADAPHPRMPQVTLVSMDTAADVSHPQIPCVTWCPLLWFMGMHNNSGHTWRTLY